MHRTKVFCEITAILILFTIHEGQGLYFVQKEVNLTLDVGGIFENQTLWKVLALQEPWEISNNSIYYSILKDPGNNSNSTLRLGIDRKNGIIRIQEINPEFYDDPQNPGIFEWKIEAIYPTTPIPTTTSTTKTPSGSLITTTNSNTNVQLSSLPPPRSGKKVQKVRMKLRIKFINSSTTTATTQDQRDKCRASKEVCFGGLEKLELEIAENTPKEIAGIILGFSKCSSDYKFQYNIDFEEAISLGGPDDLGLGQKTLKIRQNLDREAVEVYKFHINCTLIDLEGSQSFSPSLKVEPVSLSGELLVRDLNDNPPKKANGILVTLTDDQINKGYWTTFNQTVLAFSDRDSFEVNNYRLTLYNDTLGLIRLVKETNPMPWKKYPLYSYTKIVLSLNEDIVQLKHWSEPYCVRTRLRDHLISPLQHHPDHEMIFHICLHTPWTKRFSPQQQIDKMTSKPLPGGSDSDNTDTISTSITKDSNGKTDQNFKDFGFDFEDGIFEKILVRGGSKYSIVHQPFPDLANKDKSELEYYPDFSFRIEEIKLYSTYHPNNNIYDGNSLNLETSGEIQLSPLVDPTTLFGITPKSAIIYLDNRQILEERLQVRRISVRIAWINFKIEDKVDKIEQNSISSGHENENLMRANLTIFIEESVELDRETDGGTVDIVSMDKGISESEQIARDNCETKSCAEIEEPEECVIACGIGSAKACEWRPNGKISTNTSHENFVSTGDGFYFIPNFSSCSPNSDTCPDGICDELEALEPSICPQDCTSEIRGFASLRKHKDNQEHGIDFASGICTCHREDVCVCGNLPKPNSTRRNKGKNRDMSSTTSTSVVKPGEISCDGSCILALAVFSGLSCICIVFLVILLKSKGYMGKKNSEEKGSFESAELGVNEDYVDGTGELGDGISLETGFNTTHSIWSDLPGLFPDPKWEIPRQNLVLNEILGEGEFGCVRKASALGVSEREEYITVAVKILKGPDSPWKEFNAEFTLLKQVAHQNVIKLLGVCTGPGGPPLIIMEYARFGSIRGFLRKCRHLDNSGVSTNCAKYSVTPSEMLGFAWQIAKGMAYLADMKMVHRDLAGRNVLLTENKICKISDFGLTRDIYTDGSYKKQSKDKVPVKWLALECLADELYTSKSDVWSYGILLWELVNMGSSPYPGVQTEQLYHLLNSGYRMERPEGCSLELYLLMRQCWAREPSNRPNFKDLVATLANLMETGSEYIKLEIPMVSNPAYDLI